MMRDEEMNAPQKPDDMQQVFQQSLYRVDHLM